MPGVPFGLTERRVMVGILPRSLHDHPDTTWSQSVTRTPGPDHYTTFVAQIC